MARSLLHLATYQFDYQLLAVIATIRKGPIAATPDDAGGAGTSCNKLRATVRGSSLVVIRFTPSQDVEPGPPRDFLREH